MASHSRENDPFLQVQQDVLSQLSSTRQLFSSYMRIRQLATHSDSPELASARADLSAALDTLSEDAQDLHDAVAAVESSPAAFGLDAAEVTRRRHFVQDVTAEISSMQSELATRSGLPDPNMFALDDAGPRARADDDDYAAHFEEMQQQQIMRQQDEQLDDVFQTVGNLRRQADDMGRELEEQREMLEVVEHVADRVGGRLQTGMQKLQYVVKHNEDTLSSCCIGLLIMVLIILLILLLIL
ncbi:hypothetical protein TD95_003461 [Thielaviopsis punctulata]|uniref:t-SNARE affecting a late Golgi compartment protein 1 n=1 Tax=Thielaviopsis punctulata TaxID=72032 RepID=A0A0F4ZGC4_9PEZI|nr:hypothetical protein TD95_003461 [Thielaviopsis punctulata]